LLLLKILEMLVKAEDVEDAGVEWSGVEWSGQEKEQVKSGMAMGG